MLEKEGSWSWPRNVGRRDMFWIRQERWGYIRGLARGAGGKAF